MRLTSLHNLYFYLELMQHARKAILADRYLIWKKEFLERYFFGSNDNVDEEILRNEDQSK
jgi:queuine tRNA-ribosyltransferase